MADPKRFYISKNWISASKVPGKVTLDGNPLELGKNAFPSIQAVDSATLDNPDEYISK